MPGLVQTRLQLPESTGRDTHRIAGPSKRKCLCLATDSGYGARQLSWIGACEHSPDVVGRSLRTWCGEMNHTSTGGEQLADLDMSLQGPALLRMS